MASASESESTTRRLVDKTGTKSRVWKYFAFKADRYGAILDSNKPTCKQCLRSFQTKGGSRSNLAKHLKDRHPDLFRESNSWYQKNHGNSQVLVSTKFWYRDNPTQNKNYFCNRTSYTCSWKCREYEREWWWLLREWWFWYFCVCTCLSVCSRPQQTHRAVIASCSSHVLLMCLSPFVLSVWSANHRNHQRSLIHATTTLPIVCVCVCVTVSLSVRDRLPSCRHLSLSCSCSLALSLSLSLSVCLCLFYLNLCPLLSSPLLSSP